MPASLVVLVKSSRSLINSNVPERIVVKKLSLGACTIGNYVRAEDRVRVDVVRSLSSSNSWALDSLDQSVSVIDLAICFAGACDGVVLVRVVSGSSCHGIRHAVALVVVCVRPRARACRRNHLVLVVPGVGLGSVGQRVAVLVIRVRNASDLCWSVRVGVDGAGVACICIRNSVLDQDVADGVVCVGLGIGWTGRYASSYCAREAVEVVVIVCDRLCVICCRCVRQGVYVSCRIS